MQVQLHGSVYTVDGSILVFLHRDDETFFPVDNLGFDLCSLLRLYTEDNIVGFGFGHVIVDFLLLLKKLGSTLLKLGIFLVELESEDTDLILESHKD